MGLTQYIRKVYDWTLSLADRPKATWWLAGISFAESSFFPIPPDILLLPLCLGRREKAWRMALICSAASVLGGLFGYLIGYFAFQEVAQPILGFYGAMDQYAQIELWYQNYGELLVLLAGFTPIPYKVFTITSGAFHFNLLSFVFYSTLSRGLRFSIEAGLIYYFGKPAQAFIDRHFNWLCWAAAVLLVGGFVAIKFMLH